MLHILSIDPDIHLQNRVKTYLERFIECTVEIVSTPAEALTALILSTTDIILCGDLVNRSARIDFLKEIRKDFGQKPFVFYCRDISTDELIEMIIYGSVYCVKKGTPSDDLLSELTKTINIAWDQRSIRSRPCQYEVFFKQSPALMALLTMSDRDFFDVNDSFLITLGYTRDDVIGRSCTDLDLFLNPKQALILDQHIKTKERLTNFETQIRGKDGIVLEALMFADFITGEDQDYIMIVLIDMTRLRELESELEFHEHELIRYSRELAEDIEKRKRVEALLLEKSEELDRYFTSALDLLCITNTKGEFVRVNPEWEHVLGYSVQELEGRSFLDLVHPEDHEKILTVMKEPVSRQYVANLETRLLSKDGSNRWIEWRLKPIGEMIYAAARDVTDRKLAEEALRKANRQINLLTSITRHDINNLLSVIYAYLALAEPHIQDPVLLEYFKEIESETQAIQSQIAFTSTYQVLGSQDPIWQNLETAVSRLEVPKYITFHSDVNDIEIYADPILGKVFFNLLDNAIRHGEHVTDITVFSIPGNEQLTIVWEDNGIGIIPEEKEDIFKRGFGKNTGLGMFLVREILMLTDISIRETGEQGKGARFEIIVPKGKFRIRP